MTSNGKVEQRQFRVPYRLGKQLQPGLEDIVRAYQREMFVSDVARIMAVQPIPAYDPTRDYELQSHDSSNLFVYFPRVLNSNGKLINSQYFGGVVRALPQRTRILGKLVGTSEETSLQRIDSFFNLFAVEVLPAYTVDSKAPYDFDIATL